MPTERVLVLILAGGSGERLWPLTKDQSKPAVPFAGIYRIVDFPLSNCLNSRLFRIILLTQHKSLSLDRHVIEGWNIFPQELGGYIQCIPSQGRLGEYAYKGTADSVFQNIYSLQVENPDWVVVLSADHVYTMDYRDLLDYARLHQADAVVVCQERLREEATRFGVVEADSSGRIVAFHEKPADPPALPGKPDRSFISTGIYLFRTKPLVKELVRDGRNPASSHDFGRDVIPAMLQRSKLFAFPFDGYWEDIGTIDSYFSSSQAFLSPQPPISLLNRDWPIRTLHSQNPPAFLDRVRLSQSLIANGAVLQNCQVIRSIISPEVVIEDGAEVNECILLDGVKVGSGARIERAIVDKMAVIPEGHRIGGDPQRDSREFTVTPSGITVVPGSWTALDKKHDKGNQPSLTR